MKTLLTVLALAESRVNYMLWKARQDSTGR